MDRVRRRRHTTAAGTKTAQPLARQDAALIPHRTQCPHLIALVFYLFRLVPNAAPLGMTPLRKWAFLTTGLDRCHPLRTQVRNGFDHQPRKSYQSTIDVPRRVEHSFCCSFAEKMCFDPSSR